MDRSIAVAARCLALLVMSNLVTTNAQVGGEDYTNLTLIESAVSKGAVCIDGSPPSYAYREGYGNGSTSWLLLMEGGQWCASNEGCYNRSFDHFGSSYRAHGLNFSGILSSDCGLNPYFCNWHRVYIHYCDGGLYISDIEQVLHFRDRILYFRGARIYEAVMEELLNKGMRNADNAILSGSSVGGWSTIFYCDKFRTLFPNTSRVKCISDSGFFIRGEGDYAKVSEQHFAEVITFHELEGSLPKSCTSKRDPNLCMFPEYLVGDVITPLFLVESAFDSFQIEYNLKPISGGKAVWKDCTSDLILCNSIQFNILKDFGASFVKTLLKLDNSSSRGMFVDACFTHTHIKTRERWMCSSILSSVLGNRTAGQAVVDWFFDRSSFREIDTLNVFPQRCVNPYEHDPELFDRTCRAMLSCNGSLP